jgi:hypothetical protein
MRQWNPIDKFIKNRAALALDTSLSNDFATQPLRNLPACSVSPVNRIDMAIGVDVR